MGRIGVAVAPSDGNRVYALIESKDGVLVALRRRRRQLDDGQRRYARRRACRSTSRTSTVDPKNPDRVYALSFETMLSTDGGKNFKPIARQRARPTFTRSGSRPTIPSASCSARTAATCSRSTAARTGSSPRTCRSAKSIASVWATTIRTRSAADLQDNNGWCGPSNSLDPSGIQNKYWIVTVGGDGNGAFPSPTIRTGSGRIHKTARSSSTTASRKTAGLAQPYLNVQGVVVLATSKYRFNWESPIAFAPWRSRRQSDRLVSAATSSSKRPIADAAGRRSVPTSRATSSRISSRRAVRSINDVSGAEYTDTILDIEGSSLQQAARSGSAPTMGSCSSRATAASIGRTLRRRRAAVRPLRDRRALDARRRHGIRHRRRARDGRQRALRFRHARLRQNTGRKIVDGLPSNEWARAIRPDIRNRDLVYLGTEEGIWISFDGGAHWQSFQQRSADGLGARHPHAAPVRRSRHRDARPVDLHHGRRAAGAGSAAGRCARHVALHAAHGYEWTLHANDEGTYTNYAADNPPYGVTITFYQSAAAEDARRSSTSSTRAAA